MPPYDPRDYWNEKARAAGNDQMRAVCGSDPNENRCMQSAQLRALTTALKVVERNITLKDGDVLDFGCGSGRWVDYIATHGANYHGVDISDEMIAVCKSRYPSVTFELVDDLSIPFASDSFDFIFSIAVLHHNRPDSQAVLLNEITRVLRPGGFLFLFEELGASARERVFPRRMDGWIEWVEAAGYACIQRKTYEYFMITDLVNGAARSCNIPYLYRWRPSFLLRVDSVLSPLISEKRAPRDRGRGAMLFRRHL